MNYLIKKIIFTFLTIFLTFFLIEFFSALIILGSKAYNRIFDTNFYTTTKPHHFPHPIISSFLKRDGKILINPVSEFDINHYSYPYKSNLKNKSLLRTKQKNEVFVYLMGGSTIEGGGRKNFTATIPGFFENILNNKIKCKNFVVFNQGIGGHDTKFNFLHMITKIIPHGKPDIIINMQGVNNYLSYMGKRDLEKINNEEQNKIYKYLTFNEYWTLKEFNSKPLFKNIFEFFKKNFFVGHLISSLGPYLGYNFSYWYKNYKNVDFDINPGLNNYFYYLNLSRTVAENYEVKFYSFLQPVIFYKKNLTDYETKIINADKNTSHLHVPSIKLDIYEGFFNRFEKYYKKLEENTTFQNKSLYFNISKIFENESRFIFEDNVHYTKLGNEIIANELFYKLEKDLTDLCK